MGNIFEAYTATVSAFSAVKLGFLPPSVRWLWSMADGAPAIFSWVAFYKQRFALRSRESAAW